MKKGRDKTIILGCLKLAFFTFLVVGLWTGTTVSGPDYYTWTQTNWDGNADPLAQASHLSNQNGWTKYSSNDAPYGIDTSSGKVKLASLPTTIINTTLSDFNSTEFSNIEKANDGNGALRLLPSITDSFSNNQLRKWRALPSMPLFNYNSRYTRMGEYLYCIFVAGDGKQFARIKISDISDPAVLPKWQFLTSLPVPLGAGAAITSDGQYIYVLRGGGSSDVYFYLPPEGTNPGTNPFTTIDNPITLPVAGSPDPVLAWPKFSSLPEGAQKGSSLIHVGTVADYSMKVSLGGDLYVVTGGYKTSFLYYNVNNKGWRRFTNQTRISVNYGATLVYKGGDAVYLVFGDGYRGRVDKFSRSTGTWSDASKNMVFPVDLNVPSYTPTLWEGSICAYPGSGDYIYAAFVYNTFRRPYRPEVYQWDQHTIRGFYKFGPLSDANPTWQRLDDVPATWIAGGNAIIYDPKAGTADEGKKLHVFSGRNYTRPWVYNTDGAENHWETLSLPFNYSTWNSMVYVKGDTYTGNRDYIYFTVRYNWFYRYDISANKWEQLAQVPETLGDHAGQRITYLNGYIYCLVGNNSADAANGYKSGFYRYRVSQAASGTDSWDAKPTLPQFPRYDSNTSDTVYNEVNRGSCVLSVKNGGKNYIYAIRSSVTPYFYMLEIDNSNNPIGDWVSMPSTKDINGRIANFSGTSLVYPGYPEDGAQNHTYIYAWTYAYTPSPAKGSYAIFKYGPVEYDTDTDPNTIAQWTELTAVKPHDATDYYEMSIAYPGTGQYLYTTAATTDMALGRYDMASGAWIKLDTVVPAPYEYYSQAIGCNGSIYLTTYYTLNSFYRYDVAGNTWNDTQINQGGASFECGNVVRDSNNKIYFVGGKGESEISSHIWVYDATMKQWSGLMKAPFLLGRAAKAEYLSGSANSINSLYIAEGRNSNRFCKYDITSGLWSFCSSTKAPVVYGSQITTDGTSHIYLVTGGSSDAGKTVWIYDALQDTGAGDPWSEFSPTIRLPFASGTNADLMKYAQGNLYLMAQSSNLFYRYVVGSKMSGWDSNLRAVGDNGSGSTITPSGGVCLYYPGTGSKLYSIPRDGFNDFLSYDIGLNQWSSLKEMPSLPAAGMSAIIDTGERWMYVYSGNWSDHLMRYDKTDNVWDEITAMPVALRANSSLCAYKGYIYVLNGGYYDGATLSPPVFYRYNTDGDVWEQIQSPYSSTSVPFLTQGIMSLPVENPYDGKSYIYFTEGAYDGYSCSGAWLYYNTTHLLRYCISDNSWQVMSSPTSDPSWKWRYGNSMTQSGDSLYMIDGNGTNFWKYKLNDTYDTTFSVALPADYPIGRGASVAYNGYDQCIYYFPGGRQSAFYRWQPGATGWSSLAQCPVSVNDSQSNILYPGFGKYLYYLQASTWQFGDPSSVLLRYNMDPNVANADKWNELTPSSFGISGPSALLYPGGQSFYVAKGNYSPGFSKYSAFCFGDYTSKPIETGKHCKWGKITWNNIGGGSIGVSVRTGSKLIGATLTDTPDWTTVTSVEKDQNLSNAARPISSVKDTDKYIQYRLNFSTDDTSAGVTMPQLNDISIDWEKYVSEKTLISSPYNTGWINNRVRKLMWNNVGLITNPAGTGMRFQLRTSVDGNTWSDWLGPVGTRTSSYVFNDDSLYVRAGEVRKLSTAENCAGLYKEFEDFSFWQDITVTNTGTAATAAGDTVLIDINSSNTHFWNNVRSAGQDIRFFDGTNKLSYFLATFDGVNDTAQIVVKLNSAIASGANVHIYMFYGNVKAFSESNNAIRNFSALKTDTALNNIGWWDCDLKQGSISQPYTPDSSAQGSPLYLKKNVVAAPGQGLSGSGAFYMDGASGYLNTDWRSIYSYKGQARTFSLWIKPEVDPSGSCLLSSYYPYNYRIELNSARQMYVYISNVSTGTNLANFGQTVSTPVPADSNWHNIVWVLKGKSGAIIGAANNGSGKVRYTTSSAHGIAPYQQVTVAGMGESTYNVTQTITSVPDATHFDSSISYVANAGVNGTYCGPGTTSVYLDGNLIGGPWTYYITDYSYVDTTFPSGAEFIFGSYVNYDTTAKYYLYKGYVDNLSLYNTAFDSRLAKCMYGGADHKLTAAFSGVNKNNTGADLKTTGKFYTDNPTIEPLYGVFYNYSANDTLASFVQDPGTNLSGTSIKYQVSPDGYNWYWWNGGAWALTTGGTSQANIYTDINSHLPTFKNIVLPTGVTAASGDFYWRAYLMSADGTSSPALNGITVNVTNPASSYYTDPAGSENINSENENCVSDKWMQYKAILYSDGENTPTLNDVSIRYIEPSITIGAPKGGESWVSDSDENITWTSVGLEGTKPLASHGAQLQYSINNGQSWATPSIVDDTPNNGIFQWHIPFDPATQARVKITSKDYSVITATSPNPFRILGIVLNSPNGQEIWEKGSLHNVGYRTAGYAVPSTKLKLELSNDGGNTYSSILAQEQTDASPWQIPWRINQAVSDSVKLRIYDADPAYCTPSIRIVDESNEAFSIVAPPIVTIDRMVKVPEGTVLTDGKMIAGKDYRVEWHTSSQHFSDNFILEYSKDGFATAGIPIGTSPSGVSGGNFPSPSSQLQCSYLWNNVPYDISDITLKIREDPSTVPSPRDTPSPREATTSLSIIEPYFTIARPNNGEVFVSGDKETISWATTGSVAGPFKLEYCTDYNASSPETSTWNTVETNISYPYGPGSIPANVREYVWPVPAVVADRGNCRVRIMDLYTNRISDISDADFSIIKNEKITLSTPNGGEDWVMGIPYNITWVTNGQTALNRPAPVYVYLYYSTDGGITYNEIPNLGPQVAWKQAVSWTPELSSSTTNAKIKIEALDTNIHPYLLDASDAAFSIKDPSISRIWLEHSGTEATSIYATGNYDIRWENYGAISGNIKIEYRLNGAAWQTLTSSTTTQEGSDRLKPWLIPNVNEGTLLEFKMTDNNRPAVVKASGVFSVIKPVINITAPAAGFNWVVGLPGTVSWTTQGGDFQAIKRLKVQCIADATHTYDIGEITTGLEANAGSFDWTLPANAPLSTAVNKATIKIFDPDPSGSGVTATLQFNIKEPSLIVDTPTQADSWRIGSQNKTISWHRLGMVTYPIHIYCRTQDGAEHLLADVGDTSVSASWNWTSVDFPGIIPGTSYIVIRDSTVPVPIVTKFGTERNGLFTIEAPRIKILGPGDPKKIDNSTDNPNYGQQWTTTDSRGVEWECDGMMDGPLFKVEWSRSVGETVAASGTIAEGINSASRLALWSDIPQEAVGPNVRLKVTNTGSAYGTFAQSAPFTVFPVPEFLTLTAHDPVTDASTNTVRIGNTYKVKWTRNVAAFSNALELSFALTGSPTISDWRPITETPVARDLEYYTWTIPHTDMTPYAGAKLRIYDTASWKSSSAAHTEKIVSVDIGRPVFNNIKLLKPGSAQSVNCIALAEVADIRWGWDGYISEGNSVSIKLIEDLNDNGKIDIGEYNVQIGTSSNTGSYNGWIVPATAPTTNKARIVLQDIFANYGPGNEVIDASEKFTIINQPEIALVTPNGGQDYIIGTDKINFEWTSRGISVDEVKIELSSDDFNPASTPYLVTDAAHPDGKFPNTGELRDWLIQQDSAAGSHVKARISMVGRESEIFDVSNNSFRIRSGFIVKTPALNEKWATNEIKDITWDTKGAIQKVSLLYSVDNGMNFNPIPGAQNIDNTGSYSWKVPNERTDINVTKAQIMVKDAGDTEGIIQNKSELFDIIWYKIKFYIIDKDTYSPIGNLIVRSKDDAALYYPGWNVPIDLVSAQENDYISSPISHEFPAGTFVVTWSTKPDASGKSPYFDRGVEVKSNVENASKGILVELENVVSAQIEWHVILTNSYVAQSDTLSATAWIERRGKLQEPIPMDTSEPPDGIPDTLDKSNFKSCELKVYDYDTDTDTPLKVFTGILPDDKGLYKFVWNPTGLQEGKTYFVRATITYGVSSTPYTSGGTFDVSVTKAQSQMITEHAGQKTLLETITGQAAVIQTAVTTTIPQKIDEATSVIGSKIDTSTNAIKTETSAIKAETAKILTATESTIPTQIRETVEPSLRSEILNRESTMRLGSKLMVRYRTYPGLEPFITVYDPRNKLKISQSPMKEVAGSSGIYEYEVFLANGWTVGDYTIVCSESSKGTMDALIISAIRTDLEDISGQVATILGTTTSLADLKDVADTLNSQFSIIESALGKISTDLVNKVKEVASSATDIESVYGQLVKIGKELKTLGASQDVNLSKLLEVSKEKSQDIKYLKNKTQQLKAAMALNNKMVENMAHKPVTQTWFEYK